MSKIYKQEEVTHERITWISHKFAFNVTLISFTNGWKIVFANKLLKLAFEFYFNSSLK